MKTTARTTRSPKSAARLLAAVLALGTLASCASTGASGAPFGHDKGPTTTGKTNIGDIATGMALDGSGEKTYYIYNICDHEEAFHETGNQAISYTTGVPAMIGAAMMLTGAWRGEGVFNMEQLDPDPFMDMLNTQGLPWQVKELAGPLDF